MAETDLDYYTRRAAHERDMAQQATDPAVALIHNRLAAQYKAMMERPDETYILREVLDTGDSD